MDERENIANRIKQRRLECRLTAGQVAEQLNMHETNYRKYENGTRSPKTSTVAKLAQIFHCSIESLISGNIQRFLREAQEAAFYVAMVGRDSFKDGYKKNSCAVFAFWTSGVAVEVKPVIQDFFLSELEALGGSCPKAIIDLFNITKCFFEREPDETEEKLEVRCRAGVHFMAGMIEYLNHVDRDECSDEAIFAEVQAALKLPDIHYVRSWFITELFMPFVYLLSQAVLWSEDRKDDDTVITWHGFQTAICYQFYGHQLDN